MKAFFKVGPKLIFTNLLISLNFCACFCEPRAPRLQALLQASPSPGSFTLDVSDHPNTAQSPDAQVRQGNGFSHQSPKKLGKPSGAKGYGLDIYSDFLLNNDFLSLNFSQPIEAVYTSAKTQLETMMIAANSSLLTTEQLKNWSPVAEALLAALENKTGVVVYNVNQTTPGWFFCGWVNLNATFVAASGYFRMCATLASIGLDDITRTPEPGFDFRTSIIVPKNKSDDSHIYNYGGWGNRRDQKTTPGDETENAAIGGNQYLWNHGNHGNHGNQGNKGNKENNLNRQKSSKATNVEMSKEEGQSWHGWSGRWIPWPSKTSLGLRFFSQPSRPPTVKTFGFRSAKLSYRKLYERIDMAKLLSLDNRRRDVVTVNLFTDEDDLAACK